MNKVYLILATLSVSPFYIGCSGGKSAEVHYNIGHRHWLVGKNEEAVTELKKAIELDPNYVDAYIDLAVAHCQLGKHRDAISYCNKALQLKPDTAYVYEILAGASYYIGQEQDAEIYWSKAEEIYKQQGDIRGANTVKESLHRFKKQ